jgi:alpha-tubulin suppressor-like RCC1 family protein
LQLTFLAQRRSLILYPSIHSALSLAPSSEITHPLPDDDIISLHAGADHFFVRTSRTLYGFGDNRFGQLGIPPDTSFSIGNPPSVVTKFTPVDFFDGLSPIVQITTGDVHTAVVTEDGALYVFGHDGKGQCGGWKTETGEPSLVELKGEDGEALDVRVVACGSQSTVVLTSDEGLWSSGASAFGLADRFRISLLRSLMRPCRRLGPAWARGQTSSQDVRP